MGRKIKLTLVTIYSKLLVYLVILALVSILTAKLLLGTHYGDFYLFLYGIVVTATILFVFTTTFLFYKDPYTVALKSLQKTKQPLVSCIVAVKDEEEIIERCVQSFIDQTYKKKEIIIVDDASTDKTPELLKKFADKNHIKLIRLDKNVGKKKALAKGILLSKGEIIAFSDSDSILSPDAISKIVAIFNHDPRVGGVSGHCRALNGDKNFLTRVQDSWYEGQFSVRKAFESIFGAVTCVSGPLAVFRREAIFNFIPAWEHDSFLGQEFLFATDRTLTGFVLGSKYIGKKLKKKYMDSPFVQSIDYPVKDWRIVYCKSAKVWTNVPDTFRRMLKQQIRWKKSFLRNIFFTGSFYWRKPLPPAVMYYCHIFFVLVGPFIVFRHLILLPMRGNFFTAILYLSGITFIGFAFGLAYRVENKGDSKWVYRPVMSLLSTLCLSWLIFYSMLTIRRKIWARG